MDPVKALLVVDVQNDFCPGGALPVPDGDAVVPMLNSYARWFADAGLPVFASRDWHPPYSSHFATEGGRWPRHCIQNSEGARFHPDLRLPEGTVVISKGMDPRRDSYSVFQAIDENRQDFTTLLKCGGIRGLYVGGLATEHCVRCTVLEALDMGITVHLLVDAIRGIDQAASGKAIAQMIARGAIRTVFEDLPVYVR
jgi:nicotinamidase/pyrazinamidase